MVTLVANNAETAISRIELQPGINTVGRAEGNHHVIPHGSVSSRHAEIVWHDGTLSVRDLGSTNGTFVEDKPVHLSNLTHGQRLRFGVVEFVVEAPEMLAEPPAGRLRVNVPTAVKTVETAEAPPLVRTVSAAIAAVNLAAYEQPSFYQSLPGAFAYPFKRNGIILLILGAVVFLVLEFLSGFSRIIFVFTTGYLFAYMQKIIAHSAQGEDELPEFPEFGEWWSDIILPFLLFAGTFVVSFAPAIVVFLVLRENPIMVIAIIPTVIFGAIYFPMALLAVAVTDNFLALSPHVVVPSMFRVFLPYLVTCLVLGVLAGVRFGSQIALAFVPVPFLPSIALGFISLYVLVVEMRVLGLLFRSYRNRLGWLG